MYLLSLSKQDTAVKTWILLHTLAHKVLHVTARAALQLRRGLEVALLRHQAVMTYGPGAPPTLQIQPFLQECCTCSVDSV